MEAESWDDNYSDPSNDYPDPSDDYTTENPMSSELASQLLSISIYEHEHLKLRLSQLEKKICSYREIVAPISKLSEDALREIFVRCITDQDAFLQPRTCRLPKPVPICLAQVCSSWRRIAMSTPALWSTLYVRFHMYRRRDQISCEQAHEWLARSGALPLTILVDTSFVYLNDNEDGILFMKSLIQYSHRCRILRFACPHTWLKPWISVSPADVPILKTFEHQHLFPYYTLHPEGVHTLWTSLKLLSAANLKEVGLIIPDLPPEYELPRVLPLERVAFATLTQLYLRTGHASLIEMWHILDRCPQLERCLLAPGRQNPTGNATIPEGRILTLPNLAVLRLHDTRGAVGNTPEFFSHLDLPSLDSFQLYTTGSYVPWTQLKYCLCTTNLCLEFYHLQNNILRGLLLGNRFIRRLKLTSTSPDLSLQGTDVLPYLFLDSDTPEKTLCPHLQTLEIDKLPPSWSPSILFTLLSTRAQLRDDNQQGNARLRQAFLDLEDVDMNLLEKVENLESASSVRVCVTHRTLKGRPWHCGLHDRLVQPPEWPLSEWELTGGNLLSH